MGIQSVSPIRVVFIGLIAGLLFAVADALINANPLAQDLYDVYRPIARSSINAPLGLAFDLISGIVMSFLFVVLRSALPGGVVTKGMAFGAIAWFFRVAMGSAAQLVMFRMTAPALLYGLFTGLAEMLILGIFYGVLLKSA